MAIEIISKGKCECYNAPRGDAGLEGYEIRDTYKFEKCRKKGKREKYYRLYHDWDTDYYECCGATQFAENFKILEEKSVNN